MSERLSMWSEVMRARWLLDAVCPNPDCGETNTKNRKPMIDLIEHGGAYCNKCGAEWTPPRPMVHAVNE